MRARPALALLAVASSLGCAVVAPFRTPPPPPQPAFVGAPPPPPPPAPAADSAPTTETANQLARDTVLAAKATEFLSAFADWDAHVTRAGAVVFASDRDGLAQIYVGDALHPADPPRRLPTGDERVGAITLSADERTVLFTSDVGSDGAFHVSRIGVDGSGLTDLTPTGGGAIARGAPLAARDKPGVIAYDAHDTANAKASVYVQTLDSAEPAPREAYSDARGGRLVDLSPDGKRALFVRANGLEDDVAFDVDLATGKSTRLFPAEGAPSGLTARYSAAADRVFAATQRVERHAELLALDHRTGKPLAHYDETLLSHGRIDQIEVAPTGDRVAIRVDAGTHDEIRILDARTLKLVKTVETPLGEAVLGHYARDAKHFTLTLSHPETPTDVYLVDAQTGVLSPLRTEERAGLSAMPPVKVSSESIRSFDGAGIPTNLYLPEQAKPGARLPVMVLLHDGPASSAPIRWSPMLRFYLSLGYVVAEPNVRGSSGFGVDYETADDREMRADALRDVETINYWARIQPWCDTSRLVLGGIGYGGYATLLELGRQSQIWRAGIDVSGTSDLRTTELMEDQAARVHDETEFGALGKDDALLLAWSPVKYVGSISAPVFVYQGARDPLTPKDEADQLVKTLRERNVPVEYMVVPNEGHGVTRRANEAALYARTARFLEEHAGPS